MSTIDMSPRELERRAEQRRLAYRVREAADLIGVSRAQMYKLLAQGVIPGIRVGSSVRVPAAALEQWIANQLTEREQGAR